MAASLGSWLMGYWFFGFTDFLTYAYSFDLPPTKYPKARKYSWPDIEAVCSRYNAGMPIEEIAEEVGIDAPAVDNIASRYGARRPPERIGRYELHTYDGIAKEPFVCRINRPERMGRSALKRIKEKIPTDVDYTLYLIIGSKANT